MYSPVIVNRGKAKILINLQSVCTVNRINLVDNRGAVVPDRWYVEVLTADGITTTFYDNDANEVWDVLTAAALDFASGGPQ